MPTSDADRYAQLLQNLAVRIGAIRDAIERAFGVTLPTAPTLNAEFETITNAIYAAADRPRSAPVTDDRRTTRTHFVYRIDILTDDAKNILEHLAGMENLIVARAAYRAACERWPNARITLRQSPGPWKWPNAACCKFGARRMRSQREAICRAVRRWADRVRRDNRE